MTPPDGAIAVRALTPAELEDQVPALAELLREAVHGGASLGFLPPLPQRTALGYWRSLGPKLRAGACLLFVATVEEGRRVAGTGQLVLPAWPNGRHRAEVQKVMVAQALRGQGIGWRLMEAMHRAAGRYGRSLLLLNTRRGDRAERFYRALGYRVAGLIPAYTMGPHGRWYDNLLMYRVNGVRPAPKPWA